LEELPEISSTLITEFAGIRFNCSEISTLDDGRSPFTSTLPAVAPKPRSASPSSMSKPGTRFTMSAAVTGLYFLK